MTEQPLKVCRPPVCGIGAFRACHPGRSPSYPALVDFSIATRRLESLWQHVIHPLSTSDSDACLGRVGFRLPNSLDRTSAHVRCRTSSCLVLSSRSGRLRCVRYWRCCCSCLQRRIDLNCLYISRHSLSALGVRDLHDEQTVPIACV